MAVTHKAIFGTANSKVAGTTLDITGSQAVDVGDDVFLGFAFDDVGTGFTPSNNAGPSITWVQLGTTSNPTHVNARLWRGTVTAAGTLTTITITWTTNNTAKAAVAGIFTGVGTTKRGENTDSNASSNDVGTVISILTTFDWQSGDLVIGVAGYEGPGTDSLSVSEINGTTLTSITEEGQDGTTGSTVDTNITCQLAWAIATATANHSPSDDILLTSDTTAARPNVAYGTAYSAAPVASLPPVKPNFIYLRKNR